MPAIFEQAKEVWNRLPMKGKIATIAAAVSTLGLILAVVYYGSQAESAVLFSDLKPEDAQRIVEKLKAENVPYSLSNGGTTIHIPREKISEMRLEMASSGIISGGHVGFDLFDKTNFGATDFAQQINYRRAIEGELARTLEGIDEIDSARVHVTPKRESVFTEKEEGAKASIMVRVKQGKALSSERTDAIVSLVSSSIQGLDPADVSVIDARGRLLTSGRGKDGLSDAGAFNSQLDAKRKFEMETAARLISLLEPVAGIGKIRADVSADVDFSQVEQTEEKFDPESQVIRSQQTAEEKSSLTAEDKPNQVAGVRGTDPTTPVPNNQRNSTKSGNDQRVATTTNFEIDKTTTRTIGGGGRMKRLNVSVVVDYKNAEGTSVARTADELKKFEELVTAAVGADTERGDSVVVQTMPFDSSNLDGTASASWMEKNKQLLATSIKYGTLVIVAILIFLFVIRPAKKSIKAAIAPADDQKLLAESTEKNDGEKEDETDSEKRLEDTKYDNKALPEVSEPITVAELEAKMNGQEYIDDNETENPESEKLLIENESAKQLESVKQMILQNNPEDSEIVIGTLRGWLRE